MIKQNRWDPRATHKTSHTPIYYKWPIRDVIKENILFTIEEPKGT